MLFSDLISMVKSDIVPNYTTGKILVQLMILLLKSKQDISETTEQCKKMLGVIWSQCDMMQENPTVAYGMNSGLLTNYVD